MKPIIIFSIFLCLPFFCLSQTEKCGTQLWWQQNQHTPSETLPHLDDIESEVQHWIDHHENTVQYREIITIPVVVHVVWHFQKDEQNISDEQVLSQIEALNADFSAANPNLSIVPDEFQPLIADTQIEFCLATMDPAGAPTDGIVRTRTDFENVGCNDEVLFSTFKTGSDIWDSQRYLNIYVVDMPTGINGKASFPGAQTPDKDAVVINYRYFGTVGTALDHVPYHLGKTTTHEVGHFLNLKHIWGDFGCATDDLVADTPLQQSDYINSCPTHPQVSCGSNDMFMNFMDYTNDPCLAMFTVGQKQRMLATLNTCRLGLKNSKGCGMVPPINTDTLQVLSLFPNPAKEYITVYFKSHIPEQVDLYLYNSAGQIVHHGVGTCLSTYTIPTQNLAKGLYFFRLETADKTVIKKVMVGQ